MLRGVSNVESGYAGGEKENPSYEQVSGGATGHAEVIRVTYDPAIIFYEDLLTVFFGSHDPTTPNRQGADVGEQYRAVIFYENEEEKVTAEKIIREVNESLRDPSTELGAGGTRVVTQLVPFEAFYAAENYHQDYFKSNSSAPYCQIIIEPKIEKVRKRFAELVKSNN